MLDRVPFQSLSRSRSCSLVTRMPMQVRDLPQWYQPSLNSHDGCLPPARTVFCWSETDPHLQTCLGFTNPPCNTRRQTQCVQNLDESSRGTAHFSNKVRGSAVYVHRPTTTLTRGSEDKCDTISYRHASPPCGVSRQAENLTIGGFGGGRLSARAGPKSKGETQYVRKRKPSSGKDSNQRLEREAPMEDSKTIRDNCDSVIRRQKSLSTYDSRRAHLGPRNKR